MGGSTELPLDWLDALDRADADLASGRLIDGADIHRELLATLDRMQRRVA